MPLGLAARPVWRRAARIRSRKRFVVGKDVERCGAKRQNLRQSKKPKGTLARPLWFDVKASYFFLAFFFAFFLVAMFLFSLSIFHGCAVLSKKPQLMNV
jgi:hypothetical protein